MCYVSFRLEGGAKGIPGKNLRPVLGVPLISYAIRSANKARNVTRVVVSTDDPKIASVAEQEGADVVECPAEISGDTASSESAIVHTLSSLAASESYHPDLLVFMQCTSPLTLPEDIDVAITTLLETKADSVFTASPFHGFIWRAGKYGNAVEVNHDKSKRERRQDRVSEVVENGAVYVMRTSGFEVD
jgi:CMP-N-acetylneuraminic acid synthetase